MKAKYLAMFDSLADAVNFEEAVLAAIGESMPDNSENYWQWLIDQYLAS